MDFMDYLLDELTESKNKLIEVKCNVETITYKLWTNTLN